MTVYFVDDGGDGSDGSTWAKAYTSINALDAAVAFASGDIVYFGADHNCQAVNGASLTIAGPTSGLPVRFISSTVGSGTAVSYSKGTGTQIDTSEAATYDIVFDGSFALHGLLVKAGRNVNIASDVDETFYTDDCTFSLGQAGALNVPITASGLSIHRNLVIDLRDGSNTANAVVTPGIAGFFEIYGLSFINGIFRTGTIFNTGGGIGQAIVSGADLSSFTNATACEIMSAANSWRWVLSNCKTKASVVRYTGTTQSLFTCMMTNVGDADDPTSLSHKDYRGETASSATIYRSSGATVEAANVGWLVTTSAACGEGAPYHAPWIYGTVGSTGSKTFDVYITNDTADFTDAEVWLEVEYLKDSDEAQWFLASDQRVITATPANQTDDTSSTWNGSGPSFTFKQQLSVTVTVGEAGQYRARVVVGLASIAGSRFFYCDPKVTVT